MLHDIVKKGSADRSVTVRIIDSTDGTPETGVVFNTSGIDLWYRREGAAKTTITEATLAALTTAHTDGGFLHVADGVYRLDLPDAAVDTGANYCDFGGTVTGMIVIGGRIKLVAYDPESATTLGLSKFTDIETDTQDIQARLPAALTGDGNIKADAIRAGGVAWGSGAITNGSIANDAFTANKFHADVTAEFQDGLATAAALAVVDDFLDTEIAAIKAKTDNLPSDPADQSLIIAATDALATLIGDVPTNSELATALGTADDAVLAQVALVKAVTDKLDDTLEDDGGTFRFTANALEESPAGGGGGTDWDADERTAIRTILGIPASGTTPEVPAAGALKVIDDLIDTEIGAIITSLSGLSTSIGNLPTATENADELLTRDWTAIVGAPADRSVWQALRFVRNGFKPIVGATMEVLEEDDTSVAWTRALSTDPAAAPIIGIG